MTKRSPFFSSRDWHTWVSLILALPILIVGLTAIFIAHKKALGTDDVRLNAGALPGYAAMTGAPTVEPRTVLQSRDGSLWVGTLNGLYRYDGEQLQGVPQLDGLSVRGIVDTPHGLMVATKTGIWQQRDAQWHKVLKGDAWSITQLRDERLVATIKDRGIVVSTDGNQWADMGEFKNAVNALPVSDTPRPISLAKLVMDLHTGQAILGKEMEWLWIDLVGGAMTLLGLTGVYMWWRMQRRKAAAERLAH